MGKWCLTINKPKFSTKNSYAHYPFCKDLWPPKNWRLHLHPI